MSISSSTLTSGVGPGSGVGQIHIGRKALQQIIPLLQFFKVDMQVVVQKAFGCARLFGAAQFVQGIAMQIPNLHDGYTPLCFFSQQLQQLFGVHRQNRAVRPAGNGVGQRLLGLLQFHDLFLNGVLRDQPVHLHRVALTDTVGAVGGLILRGKVPPSGRSG